VWSMSDFHDRGQLKIIAIKKSGSSTLRRTFEEKLWTHNDWPETRYVTAIRHPAARMVSCWNHLVKDRTEGFAGPHLPFPEWVEYVIETPDSELDHHVCSQVHDLVGRCLETEGPCRLWIGMLEKLNVSEGALSTYCKRQLGIAGSAGGHVRHRHGPWPTYYDKRLLQRVRSRFHDDMRLWLRLYPDGYWVSGDDMPLLNHFQWAEAYHMNKIV